MTLDLVIPAHNEERRIVRTLRAYSEAFTGDDVRFKVALDGCVDRTAEVVLDPHHRRPPHRTVRVPEARQGWGADGGVPAL